MGKKYITFFILLLISSFLLISNTLYSYPDEEKAQLSLTGVGAQAVQMYLSTDNRYLYLGYNNKVSIVDLGSFDLAATQPYDFSADSELAGVVGGLALSSSKMYVSKDDGKVLRFTLSDISAKPTNITISSGVVLGKTWLNSAGTTLYIADMTNNAVLAYTVGTTSTVQSVPLSGVTGVGITDMYMIYELTSEDYLYIATDKGVVFYIIDGSLSAGYVDVSSGASDIILRLAAKTNKDYLYAINFTDDSLLVLNPSTLEVFSTITMIIDSSGTPIYNTPLSGVVSANTTNPTSKYTFVSGLQGISVLDPNNNFINVGGGVAFQYTPITISEGRYGPMVASTDGYIYMTNAGGSLSVVTANPYVTVSSVTYSAGGSSLGVGETCSITFQSDEDATYVVRAGGNVDRSGSLITDTTGATSNSVTAATDTVFTFAYDTNSSILDEGANSIFIFATDSVSDIGRDLTSVTVDTPPPAVTVNSTSFGNARIYINMNRLTVSDMDHYNIYVSTNTADVDNRTVTPTQISQPSSGTTLTAEISGLTNEVLYYASVEAVDAAGNVGPLTTTLTSGARISATPRLTVGPAQLAGQGSCSLNRNNGFRGLQLCCVFFSLFVYVLLRLKKYVKLLNMKRFFCGILLLLVLLPFNAQAEEASPQWMTTELKGGFWIPASAELKRFFDPFVHMFGMLEQGFLYQSKLGVELGIGFLSENGNAISATTGERSSDKFNLFLLPLETNITFRADFLEDQLLVPYVKFGGDYVFFRQNLKGTVVKDWKFGIHGVLGLQILLDMLDRDTKSTMERDWGVNDVYFTIEGRYNYINNFGGGGLNLSSYMVCFGLLFEY